MKDGRKLLRLTGRDALGVRFWIPALLMLTGNRSGAERSLKALDAFDPQTILLRGFYRLMHGIDGGLQDVVMVLMMLPGLRGMLLAKNPHPPREMMLWNAIDLRPVADLLDLMNMQDQFDVAEIEALVNVPAFIEAVQELDALRIRERKAVRKNPSVVIDETWERECLRLSRLVANQVSLPSVKAPASPTTEVPDVYFRPSQSIDNFGMSINSRVPI